MTVQTETLQPLCGAEYQGLKCGLPAGHTPSNKHAEADSFDDEGRVDGAITWTDVQAFQHALAEKAKALIPNGDYKALEAAQQLLSMDDESLIETAGAIKAQITKARAAFEADIANDCMIARIAETVMQSRIRERGARMLPSDRYKVAIETGAPKPQKRFDILGQLEGKIPAAILCKALWRTITIKAGKQFAPSEIEQLKPLLGDRGAVEYDGDVTQLKKLAKDYGGEVAQIVKDGVVYVDGAERFVFEPLESAQQNVTPLRAVS